MKTFNSVRKRLSHRCFSVNFEKFLGSCFAEHLAATFHMTLFFTFLQIGEVCSLKSIHLVEQSWIRGRNSQAYSILCSYGNQVETSLLSCCHTCTHLGILIAEKVEKKEKLTDLLLCGKFSFHVTAHREFFTYEKNKK